MNEQIKKLPIEQQIVRPLLAWYEKEKRDLPWRRDPNAYRVWVSEIMLQQTRVEAVKPYYARFMEALPDVKALAEADETLLLKLWEGLGYYNRVRNMQKAAKIMVERYGGAFPETYGEIRSLPGIGSYTAGAVCSIAFGLPVPAVDGNVLRVISRILARDWDIARQSVKRSVEEMLAGVMPKDAPGQFNQALMELGATVCVPNGIARCDACPVAVLCLAKKQDLILKLPVKSQKKTRRIEEKTVLILKGQAGVALLRRPAKGLLAGMYEFPNLSGYQNEKQVLDFLKGQGISAVRIRPLPAAKHVFTHVEWHMKGYLVQLDETTGGGIGSAGGGMFFAQPSQIQKSYAMPSAFGAYMPYIL